MLKAVVSPLRDSTTRNVVIKDENNRIVAVMNTRELGVDAAGALAVMFAKARETQAKLDAALETIRNLQTEESRA